MGESALPCLEAKNKSQCGRQQERLLLLSEPAVARQGPHLTWKKSLPAASGLGNQTSCGDQSSIVAFG